MDWPSQVVEDIPPRIFRPPFCPWPACYSHRPGDASSARFRRHGVFVRRFDGRVVPRFRCLACGRTCSLQTFAFSYYLKRPALSVPIAAGLVAGSAHRQLGRSLGCSPSTVTRRSARLGRHGLLLCSLARSAVAAIPEPVVVDHFETFAFSQDHPVGLATAVGSRSWFVYDLDPAPHRRAGHLSPAQRHRLARHRPRRPPWGGYERSFHRVLDLLAAGAPGPAPLTLVSDGHLSYAQALARHPERRRFTHFTYPNPPRGPKGSPRSPQARVRDRAMFPVDLLHGLMRHSCAHHRRETIAFGRRVNALLERGFLLAAWRNFVKGRSERRRDAPTPAIELGLTPERWSWQRLLARRLFPSRLQVPEAWMRTYRREWGTPDIGHDAPHTLKRAY